MLGRLFLSEGGSLAFGAVPLSVDVGWRVGGGWGALSSSRLWTVAWVMEAAGATIFLTCLGFTCLGFPRCPPLHDAGVTGNVGAWSPLLAGLPCLLSLGIASPIHRRRTILPP